MNRRDVSPAFPLRSSLWSPYSFGQSCLMLPLWPTLVLFRDLHARNPSNDQLGLLGHSVWAKGRKEGITPTPTETMARERLLRVSISLFLGTVCTSSIALFLLLWITSNSRISVDSLHHDFQTVYIVTTDQWTRDPRLRTAVELRWLWASLSVVLGIGLFPKERVGQVVGWFASVKMYIRMRFVARPTRRNSLLTIAQEMASIRFEFGLPWIPPRVHLQNPKPILQ